MNAATLGTERVANPDAAWDALHGADELLVYAHAHPPEPGQVAAHIQEATAREITRCTAALRLTLEWQLRRRLTYRLEQLQRMHAKAVELERGHERPSLQQSALVVVLQGAIRLAREIELGPATATPMLSPTLRPPLDDE